MVSANSSTSAGGLASAETGMRPTRYGASHAMTARSLCTRWPTDGRCTFTTTSVPSSRVARCTWAIDAAATGVALEAGEGGGDLAAQLLLDDPLHHVPRLGRHLVAALLELGDDLLGEDALARREDLPELDVGGAEGLGGLADAPGDAGDLRGAARPPLGDGPHGDRGAEVAHGGDHPQARRDAAGSGEVREAAGDVEAELVGGGEPGDLVEVDDPRAVLGVGAEHEVCGRGLGHRPSIAPHDSGQTFETRRSIA